MFGIPTTEMLRVGGAIASSWAAAQEFLRRAKAAGMLPSEAALSDFIVSSFTVELPGLDLEVKKHFANGLARMILNLDRSASDADAAATTDPARSFRDL